MATFKTVPEAALNSWVISTNESTGLSHPNDRDRLIETLRRLRDAGYVLDTGTVRTVLPGKGFTRRHVEEVVSLVERFNNGSRLQQKDSGPWWKDSVVDAWRAEAGESGDTD